jgi:hypothetical protein
MARLYLLCLYGGEDSSPTDNFKDQLMFTDHEKYAVTCCITLMREINVE